MLAPGFSGSIVAIMIGIYQDLLRVISNPLKKLKENIIFCLPLAAGMIVSAVFFVVAFSFLFDAHKKATYLLFVALIAGNLPVIYSETKQYGFRKYNLLCGSVAMIVALALALLVSSGGASPSGEGLTAGLPLLVLSGLVAGGALLVPGMSFSMILILAGVYGQIIEAAKLLLLGSADYILPIGLFILSVATGLVISSRIIRAVFNKYPALANSTVLGFIIGSLLGMLAQSLMMDDLGFVWWHGAVGLAAGLVLSVLIVALSRFMKASTKAAK